MTPRKQRESSCTPSCDLAAVPSGRLQQGAGDAAPRVSLEMFEPLESATKGLQHPRRMRVATSNIADSTTPRRQQWETHSQKQCTPMAQVGDIQIQRIPTHTPEPHRERSPGEVKIMEATAGASCTDRVPIPGRAIAQSSSRKRNFQLTSEETPKRGHFRTARDGSEQETQALIHRHQGGDARRDNEHIDLPVIDGR